MSVCQCQPSPQSTTSSNFSSRNSLAQMIPRSLRSMRRNIQKVRCHCFLSSLSFFLFVFEFNFKWFILSIGLELKLFFEGFSNYYCFIFIFLWSLICFFVLFFLAAKNEVLYVAIDDHAAQSDDDLMFLKGELITVTRRLNEIMWEVSFFLSFFFFLFFCSNEIETLMD